MSPYKIGKLKSLFFTGSGGCRCSPKATDVIEPIQKPKRPLQSAYCPKIHNSVAVVKESEDPYLDFRRSMLQMIFEKEMYSKNDLQQLLDCFLQLNSPHHHRTIIRAFMEIWNGEEAIFSGGAHIN